MGTLHPLSHQPTRWMLQFFPDDRQGIKALKGEFLMKDAQQVREEMRSKPDAKSVPTTTVSRDLRRQETALTGAQRNLNQDNN